MTPAGICGTAQCLQMDTTRRVRPTGMAKPSNNADSSMVMLLADVKTVTYSLGDPGTASPTEGGNSSNGQTGLYRREVDRPAYVSAMQQGQTDILTQTTSKLAPRGRERAVHVLRQHNHLRPMGFQHARQFAGRNQGGHYAPPGGCKIAERRCFGFGRQFDIRDL